MTTEDAPPVVSSAIQVSDDARTYYPLQSFVIPAHYAPYLDSVLLPRGLVTNRVAKLAQDLRAYYRGKTIHLLVVLKGGICFFHDLIEHLRRIPTTTGVVPFTFDFIKVSSYAGLESSGRLEISGTDLASLKDKHVVLVEDIIDTGLTMSRLVPMLKEQHEPASLEVTTLLDKRTSKSNGFQVRRVLCSHIHNLSVVVVRPSLSGFRFPMHLSLDMAWITMKSIVIWIIFALSIKPGLTNGHSNIYIYIDDS